MSLPKSVQRQAAAAADHYKPKQEDRPEDDSREDVEAKEQPGKPDAEQQAAAEKQPSPTKQDEPKKDEPARDQDAAYWKHRHDVIQGKYNREVPELHQKVRALEKQLSDKDTELATAKQAGPEPTDGNGNLDLNRMRETYGDEMVDDLVALIQSQAGSATAKTPEELEQLNQRLSSIEEDRQVDAQARFWVDLKRLVPDFKQVNQDPGFLNFLAGFDPQTGEQYQQSLSSAQQSNDAYGVAEVFKLYKERSGKPKQREIPDDEVTPHSTRTSDAPQGSGQKQWTRAEIRQFYRDKTSGRVKGKKAEELEADIFAAQAEGRVTG